jgi:hypothetical protein
VTNNKGIYGTILSTNFARRKGKIFNYDFISVIDGTPVKVTSYMYGRNCNF